MTSGDAVNLDKLRDSTEFTYKCIKPRGNWTESYKHRYFGEPFEDKDVVNKHYK